MRPSKPNLPCFPTRQRMLRRTLVGRANMHRIVRKENVYLIRFNYSSKLKISPGDDDRDRNMGGMKNNRVTLDGLSKGPERT